MTPRKKRTSQRIIENREAMKKDTGKSAGLKNPGEEKPPPPPSSPGAVMDSIFWVGADARLLYVNDTACRKLGYTRRELLGMTVFDVNPDFDQDIWPNHWEKVKERGYTKLEARVRTKEGHVFPVEADISYLEFNGKEYHCTHVQDISERKLAEEALCESEAKFRLLSERSLLALAIFQDGKLKYMNQAASDLVGYSIDEMLGCGLDEIEKTIHPDDRQFVMEQLRKKLRSERDVANHYSYRAVARSGEMKWVELYSTPVTYAGRNADFVSLVDITERKEVEEALRKARGELEFLVEERTVELTEANRQLKRRIFDLYTIFELSRNFNAVLNYETLLDSFVLTSMGQMGASKASLYLPGKAGGIEFHLARAKGSPPFPEKEIIIDPEGQFGKFITALNRPVYISDVSRKLSDSEGFDFINYFENGLVVPLIFQTKLRGLLIISGKESGRRFQDEDIEFLSILANQTAVSIENTRLYDSEKEALGRLQKAQKLLLQSERLAVLGELSAKIAHEVNNPLGIIKNYLHLLSRQSDGSEKTFEYTNVVRLEIDRISQIVRHLLSINKPKRIRFAPTDLKKVLNEVVSLMSRQLDEAKVRMSLEIKEPLPEIMAWPEGLKQLLMNLLLNARDAMPGGGEVHLGAVSTEHTVQITIQDTGSGIEPKHIPHIFEPFYSTKVNGAGTGLGLSVCHNIVKNHNGTIAFKNNERGGFFKIELPIEQEEEEYEWRI